MKINSKILAKALYQSLLDTPGKESELAQEFVKYLEEKNLIGLLPAVVKNLEYLQEKAAAQEKIKLTINHKLLAEVVKEIKKFVFENVGTGRDLPVQTEIIEDSSMLGGFVAEYKNKIYDGSVKSQLAAARRKMLSNN